VPPLVAVLGDKDADVRASAALALGRIGDARAVPLLIDVFKYQDPDNWVRQNAAEALGAIGDARAVAPLIAALGEGSLGVRKAAARGLVALYQAGRLDEEARKQVLGVRNVVQAHKDAPLHQDQDVGCLHSDQTRHQDEGLGIAFPL
jgi:HEAT repeat protein